MKRTFYRIIGSYLNTMARFFPKVAAKQGFLLFCYPSRIPLRKHHHEFLDTAHQSVFQYRKNNIRVYRWGNGPRKILFLHGWQSHSFRWKNYIESLPKHEFTIFSLDAPGHGNSTGSMLHVPMYSEVIKLFIESVGEIDTLVGHSMGGFAASHTLYTAPLLPVKKLVLMGTPGEGMDFSKLFKKTLTLSDQVIDLTLAYFKELYGKPMEFFSTSRFVSNLRIPGLIVHDKYDREAPYHYAWLNNHIWKNSTLVTTEGLEHNLKSDMVVKHVIEFIDRDTHETLLHANFS